MEKVRFIEFSQLNADALTLQAEIDKNLKELFGEE